MKELIKDHLIGNVKFECVIKAYEHLHLSNITYKPELKKSDSQLESLKDTTNDSKHGSSEMNKPCQSVHQTESLQSMLDNLKHLCEFFLAQEQRHLSCILKKLSEDFIHLCNSLTFEKQCEIINKSDTLKKLGILLKDLFDSCVTKKQYEKVYQSEARGKLLENLMQLCSLLEDDNQYIAVRESIAENQLVFDLKRAYDHGLHTDINLRVGKNTIAAHRLILCGRSPVFAEMFEHETSQEAGKVIDIPDVEFNVLKKFVVFLYSSELDNDDLDTLCCLYYVADKYEVFDLRLKCRKMMVAILSIDNACRILALGDNHNDVFLKNKAIKFIKLRLKDVAQTKGWIEFMDSKLSAEVLI